MPSTSRWNSKSDWSTDSVSTLYRWTERMLVNGVEQTGTLLGSEHSTSDGPIPRALASRPSLRLSSKSTHTPPVPPHSNLFTSMPGTIIEPGACSPTTSVFSVPSSTYTTAGRNSIATYMSTSHVPLRGGGIGIAPPTQPTQRERRRLRKKSRPPASSLYSNVFELTESPGHRDSRSPSPSTHHTSSAQDTSPELSLHPEAPTPPSAPTAKVSSRIGLVRRWGRGKRENAVAERSQPVNDVAGVQHAPPPNSHRSWFFSLWRS
ncbi:hypothetical protein FIBSPDRAFT_269438 [Athelia psychrophila]|uniref:Uncharacterized protein n=1 Tax=Athelia psychrophila TaxID=1759441 RepID=A0A165X3U5_9AGAM|nr:hypothetical protein FIBSPDRAFT_269438 [Fibularhizoctonia sp. CBS 109695]